MTKKLIKKSIGILLVIFQFLGTAPSVLADRAEGEKRMFLVTAYYSPLPDQEFYIRGSYEADIRLNGRGTNGADGTQVYDGMLAAPKTYPFGTRVRIPGLGVGEVHDRGGAILSGKNYDRIDVWMGRGEEGLARALNWGARLVTGEIFWDSDQVEPSLDYYWVKSDYSPGWLKQLKKAGLQNPAVFNKPITRVSESADIKQLQEALTTFGYFHGDIDGVYGPQTSEAVKVFQMDEGVIASADSAGAGHFGPKTQAALKKKLENYNSEVEKELKRLEENRLMLASGLGRDEDGDDVTALQRMLWELNYYEGDLTGIYDEKTMDAVFEFQKDNGILQNEWEKGAGYFGKKTHAALTAALEEKMKRVGKFPLEMQTWVPARQDLPRVASLTVTGEPLERQALHFEPDLMNTKFVHEITDPFKLNQEIDLDQKGEEVVKLQNILIKNGYLKSGM
ncbi:peptidoglycan-binding protein, partial [Candidatus Peregrinibacteria bacterium]|nr:peptidoglycan-binding protein [Candidatus Peregrinibacteria bacterium]